MSDEQQLRWEAENGPKFAIVAFASAAFSVLFVVLQAVALRGASNDREQLRATNEHNAEILLANAAQVLSVVTFIAALYYLYRVIVARRPESLRRLWPVAPLAPILLAVAGISGYLDLVDGAREFVSGTQMDEKEADRISGERSTVTLAFGRAGYLALAVTYVLAGVNGMRAGLFSRFMGILAIVSGVLLVLPVLPGGFIQLFWIVALGMLFLGRWPNGRGPAWDVVEPVPWPTAADVQAARQAAEADGPEPAEPEGEGDEGDEPRQRPTSRKRKRR